MAESPELKIVAPMPDATSRICLLVVGMHRSGTSALTRALNILGASAPNVVLGAEPHNEAGHWEPERIVAIHEEMLFRADSRWDDWRALSLDDLSARDRRTYKATLARLLSEEFGTSRLFVLKDPRICRFIPLYEELLGSARIEARFLLPFRNPLEVADSLKARDKISRGYAGLLWLRHTLDAEAATRGKQRTLSRYEDLMVDYQSELQRIGTELNLSWPTPVSKAKTKLSEHFRDDLRHQEATLLELLASTDMPVWVKDAYECFLQLNSNPDDEKILHRLDIIRAEFDAACLSLGVPAFDEFIRREAAWQTEASELKNTLAAHRKEIETLQSFRQESAALRESLNQSTEGLRSRDAELEQLRPLVQEKIHLQERLAELSEHVAARTVEVAKLEQLNEAFAARVSDTEAKLDHAIRLQNVQRAELDEAQTQRDESLAALAQTNAKLLDAKGQLNSLQTAVGVQTAEAELYLHERDEALAQSAAYSEQVHRLQQQLDFASAQSKTWETRVIEIHRQHTNDIAALTSSTSWKLTRPIRGIKRFVSEPGFRANLARAVARKVFNALPLSAAAKRKMRERYGRWRLLRSSPQIPVHPVVPAIPVATHTESPDQGLKPSSPPTVEIPADGRWNVEFFEQNQTRIAALMAALRSRPSELPIDPSDLTPAELKSGKLVSLIVRTHGNRTGLLTRALRSIEAQDYRPIEIIIADDGGLTDEKILAPFEAVAGLTVRFIKLPKSGRSEAANAGLREATGHYAGFLDDDDYLLPGHLGRLCGLLETRNDLDAAYAGALEIAADLDPETLTHLDETRTAIFLRPIANTAELLDRNPFPIQTVVFRRSLLGPQDQFDPNLDALEDWLFWMRLLCGKKVGGVAEITSAFYVPKSQAAHERRIKSHIAAEPYFVTQRRALYEERRLSDIGLVHTRVRELYRAAGERAARPLAIHPASTHLKQPDTPLHQTLRTRSIELGHADNKDRIVAYTSINLRYLPKALAWAKSVKAHNPDWETHILLNDVLPLDAASWPNIDRVFPISALEIPGFHAWAFGMRVVELCTATKPFYARKLLDAGYAHVFFFDPDTHVYSDLNQLVDEFGENSVLITPHCSEDAVRDAEIHYNEVSSLAHGVFNLGFLGLRNSPEAGKVIDFWCRRLIRHCVDDHARGLFTDQKWFNLVPVFFEGVKVLKHRGCNTASWNIARRPMTMRDGVIYAGCDPLIFFHFSGYDKNVPRTLFDIFGRYNDVLEKLIEDYDDVNDRFSSRFPVWKQEWSLARYDNGLEIPDAHREIFKRHYQFQLLYAEPFFTGANSFHEEISRRSPQALEKLVDPPGFLRRYY